LSGKSVGKRETVKKGDNSKTSRAGFILVTATRVSAKTILAKPNLRSVGETELHPPFNMSDWSGENLRQELCL
jgi:hypothetical protein